MLTVMLFDVILTAASGLPKDDYVNTFHFLVQDDDGGAHTDIAAALVDYYNTNGTSGVSVSGYMSPSRDRSGATSDIVGYSLLDPEPRTPRYGPSPWTLDDAVFNTRLPAEVALCMSYYAPPQSGIADARRRGRVFLGDWVSQTNSTSTGRPSTDLTDTVRDAGQRLLDASQAADDPADDTGGWRWVVYSPTIAALTGNTPLDAYAEVTGGWVDDEWDTMRKRGREAETRFSFS